MEDVDARMLEAVATAARRALGERHFERLRQSHTTCREAVGRLKEERSDGAVYETSLGDCFVPVGGGGGGSGPWRRTGSLQTLPCGPGCATPLWAARVDAREEGWDTVGRAVPRSGRHGRRGGGGA
jgi:hypothetical protein